MGAFRRRPPVALTVVVAALLSFALSGGGTGTEPHLSLGNIPAWGSADWGGQQAVLSSRFDNELLTAGTVGGPGRIAARTGGAPHLGATASRCCAQSQGDDHPQTVTAAGPVRLRSPPG